MIKTFFLLAVCFVLLSSCNRNDSPVITFNRDTALNSYLQFLDSLPYYDTSDLNYKALKAYKNNDSNFFYEFSNEQKIKKEFQNQLASNDTCIKLANLQDLSVDQAYRFKFIPAFCSMPIVTTITKKGDIINLHFIVYQTQYDTINCKMINEIKKQLTLKNWEDFCLKLKQADIWGLKRENGISGLDGSKITFTGFENYPNRDLPSRHFYIERWGSSTLNDAFNYTILMSGNTKGYFYIKQN
jgi:hypothetical protein